jgi:hypothetical protein
VADVFVVVVDVTEMDLVDGAERRECRVWPLTVTSRQRIFRTRLAWSVQCATFCGERDGLAEVQGSRIRSGLAENIASML